MAKNNSIENVLKQIDTLTKSETLVSDSNSYVTIRISTDYKAKFDDLQRKTGRKFSKVIRDLIVVAVDHAEKAV